MRAGVGEAVGAAIEWSVAEPTRKRYTSVWEKYREWCEGLGETPLPVSEDKATAYVVTLAKEGLKGGAVKYHLAGIRWAQIKAGLGAPQWSAMTRLAQVRKGLARMEVVGEKDRLKRGPVRWHHLVTMKASWDRDGRKGTMLWAVACCCFFGCLRVGEALTPDGVSFDEKAHLTWEDVVLEDAPRPGWIRLCIKESKTDRLRTGVMVTLYSREDELCPVRAVLLFMAARGRGPGPFFADEDGKGLTRRSFVSEVKCALEKAGLSASGISGHSFRIGAATAAAERGASDEDVKALGRWKSREYRGYIRKKEGAQAGAAKKWTEASKVKRDQQSELDRSQ